MTRDQIIETRQALVTQLPVTGELLRGSLFERTVRHTSGCTICAGGGGHPLWVLTTSYAGGRARPLPSPDNSPACADCTSSNASLALTGTTSPVPDEPRSPPAAALPNTPSSQLSPDESAHLMQTLSS